MNETTTRTAANEVISRLEERLAPSGWNVHLGTIKPPRFSIVFEHALTSDVILSVDSEKGSTEGKIDEFVSHPEFERMREAPIEAPHAELIRAIRENAKGGEWPADVIERLALILKVQGLLSAAEAEWLERAGAAWSDILPE
jgi:hypothetical protein